MVTRASMTPVGRKTVTALELLHRGDDRGIVFVRNAHADQVAADLESAMQRDDLGPAVAGLHRLDRHHRPAAIGNDRAIFHDRRLCGSDIRLGERRRTESRIHNPGAG